MVSNSHKPYTMVSEEQIIQIAGRCRSSEGLYSHTIIHNQDNHPPVDIATYQRQLDHKVNTIITFKQSNG